MNDQRKTWPQRCGCSSADYIALERALTRGSGWGAEAGSTLSQSIAAVALLDWAEDARAARLSQQELTRRIRRWLEAADSDTRADFRANWQGIADHADDIVVDITPHLGRLESAGNPQKRTDYGPRHWASLKRAIEQALND